MSDDHRPDACCDVAHLHERLRALRDQLLAERLRPRFWFARAVVALEILVLLVAVSWFERSSLTSQAIEASGPHGWLLIHGTAFCCLVALFDVVVNDLMPARYTLPSAMRWRHLGFMGIALQLSAIGLLVVFAKGFTVLVLAYWLNAVLASVLTFFDAFARYPRRRPWHI
jgi:hypothetical protein